MVMEEKSVKLRNFEAVIKIISPNKLFPEEIIEHLKAAFNCQPTSPLMYSQEKDCFFVYITVEKKEA